MNQAEIAKLFLNDRNSTRQTRDEMNQDIGSSSIKLWEQSKEFYRNAALLSVGGLGLMQVLTELIRVQAYLYVAVGLYMSVVLYILLITREELDRESNGLQAMSDRYNSMFDNKLVLIKRYMDAGIMTDASWEQYGTELENLPSAQEILQDGERLRAKRGNREQDLRFVGEIVLALFLVAVFFSGLALYGPVSLGVIISGIFLGVMLAFTDSANFLTIHISRLTLWLKGLKDNSRDC